jgi:DNA-binding response OmpR family regulator
VIVDQDFDFGIKLADWLAAHGYQAVLVRSMETAINDWKNLNPQAVLIGLDHVEPTALIDLRGLFRSIETACARVPVITLGSRPSWGLTDFPNGGAVRHLHLPIKPIEFTYIGRLLRSEISAATASPNSPSTEAGFPDQWPIDPSSPRRTIRTKVATWIA